METAQGPFSSLDPLELASAPGLPGLSTIDQTGSYPAAGSAQDALNELTVYADELKKEQAMALAIRSSRTDMLAATPAQTYCVDTRNSKWTLTNAQNGFAQSGETVAYLASAQCVDLSTTRLTGSISITLPATDTPGNTKYFTAPPLLPLCLFTFGVQIGANGNVLQDVGTATDQIWLTQSRLFKKDFNKSDLFCTSNIRDSNNNLDGSVLSYNTAVNNNANTAGIQDNVFQSTAAAKTLVFTFTIRPNHSFFGIEKTWPPNLPIKLICRWNQATLVSLFQPSAAQNPAAVSSVQLRIHTIRSEEIYFIPEMRQAIMNGFATGPVNNMNQLAAARTFNKNAMYDPRFNMPQFDPVQVAGIFQFEVFRLSRHAMSGNSFYINPVLNGSARPKILVLSFPHAFIPYSASLSPDGGTTFLKSLQVLYNGQTVWDEPYTQISDVGNNMLPLYAETRRYAKADAGQCYPSIGYVNYDRWAADNAFIVVRLAPSHNDNEIQPNDSAPVEIRGEFTGAVPASTTAIVALFYDQTMLMQRNNTAIFSLPIY